MRRPLIAGNWKMHKGVADTAAFIEALQAAGSNPAVEVVVAPPYTSLPAAAMLLTASSIGLAAQNVHWEAAGAFTGEVSAAMLREFGCTHVIVGHSERRSLYGEDDGRVAAKFGAAAQAGLTPILCVGETLAQRESGATESVVEAQLNAVLAQHGASGLARAVIAYEPVWAIGTGRTATPDQAQAEML